MSFLKRRILTIFFEGRMVPVKAIVCEMCGSQDLVKKDGVYVCQNCGTKYDPEEAKKLMVEVTIDNSAKIQNLYQLARRAYEEHNFEDAANYYQQIAVENPDDWETNFYRVLCKQCLCTVTDLPSAISAISNNLQSTKNLIHNSTMNYEEKKQATEKVVASVWQFSDVVSSALFDAYGPLNHDYDAQYARRDGRNANCLMQIRAAELLLDFNDNSMLLQAYKNAVDETNISKQWGNYPVFTAEEIQQIRKQAADLDANYKLPDDFVPQNTKKSGGCYVATAVYGSYDCPQVWTLRRYRDYTLAESWYGRAFIHTYYAISPTLVKWLGETEWFKNLWKPKLDKMVKELNEKGVADTPYQDRNW